MAIQFTDFTNAKRHEDKFSGIGDVLPNILAGYKASKAPEEHQTEMDYKRALTEKALREASEGSTLQGMARDRDDLEKLRKKYGDDSPVYQGALRDFQLKEAVQKSLVGQRNQNIEYAPWKNLKADDQYQITGQYRALGIDARRGIELWNAGWTPEKIQQQRMQQGGGGGQDMQGGNQMLQQPGMQNMQGMQGGQEAPEDLFSEVISKPSGVPNIGANSAQVLPESAMTGSNRTDEIRNRSNSAEADYIGQIVTDWTAPFAQQVNNMSFKDLWTSVAKRNDPAATLERRKFLAAQMMGPEGALLNIKLANGSNAHQAIDSLQQQMKTKARTLGITITPEDYRVASNLMHHTLRNGARIRSDSMKGATDFSHIIGEAQEKSEGNTKSGKTVKRMLDGVTLNIPEHLVAQFDRDHK